MRKSRYVDALRMTSFSAPESKNRKSQLRFGNKERENEDCYLSDEPVMYAQALTKTSVRQAPANPETRNLI